MELEGSGYRDHFEFETRWAAQPLDLLRALRKLKPTVVHYSGHGGQNGLFFQAADGSAQLMSTDALEQTFGAAGSSVKLVVLNACYSEAQAEALLAHVDCVVGMSGAIQDGASRNFAIGFYGGLGERESVEAAYKQGCAAISMEEPSGGNQAEMKDRDVTSSTPERQASRSDSDRPQLKVRAGVNANLLVLAADSR
jgi:hypothetical protein